MKSDRRHDFDTEDLIPRGDVSTAKRLSPWYVRWRIEGMLYLPYLISTHTVALLLRYLNHGSPVGERFR